MLLVRRGFMTLTNDLAALAIIPGVVIILYVYGKDKVEKEPIRLIIKLIIFGILSCFAAGTLEQIANNFLPQYPQGSLGYALINAFALAAFWEEIVKYTALRIGSWKDPSFNYRFDGVVYGVSAAVGFAIYENIMYVAMYGFQTAVVRAFMAVPLHAFCGVFMGVFYSYSKKASILGNKSAQTSYTILSLVVPMLIHGVYDTFAFLQSQTAQTALLVFVVLLYIAAVSTIKKLSAADYRSGFYPQARVIDYDVDL